MRRKRTIMLLIFVIKQSWGERGDVAQPYNFSLMGTVWEHSVYAFDAAVLFKCQTASMFRVYRILNLWEYLIENSWRFTNNKSKCKWSVRFYCFPCNLPPERQTHIMSSLCSCKLRAIKIKLWKILKNIVYKNKGCPLILSRNITLRISGHNNSVL